MKLTLIPAPDVLKHDVDCFRISQHSGEGTAIHVAPKAVPGIVFQHDNGQSALENIVTPSHVTPTPTLFLYGAVAEPSVMHFKAGSYTSIQVVMKPGALNSLFGLNAAALAHEPADLNDFAGNDLNLQLMEARNNRKRVSLLTHFLLKQLQRQRNRDRLVEESLRLIHCYHGAVSVKGLREHLNLSERQFERRFSQTVGLSPQVYIRVARFNEAIRLIKTGRYEKLTDIAHALCYYDQSHFIRDIKTFSGLTPKELSLKTGDSYHDQLGYSYT
jgi:AraC-like DNA-binding protein